jgi:periplasmic divalent cation tolerance protein
MRAIVVVTTVGTEEQAYLIAREIVARRQAACVNILPGVRSIYRWKGKICKDGELMLLVKTLEGEFEGVMATIRELHSYELPEILSFTVAEGERGFLDWIAGSVDKDADFADDDDDDDEEEGLAYAGVDSDDD